MAETLGFGLLGPLEITVDGDDCTPKGRHQRVLLTLLLVRLNETVPSEQLADRLWDGRPPPTALNALQVYVSQLRKLFPGRTVIETVAPGYRLAAPASTLDLYRFQDKWRRGRELFEAGDGRQASELLREALSLWRGDPLVDVQYDAFGGAEARRLEEMRLDATIDRIQVDLALGRHSQVIGELGALVDLHPLREQFASLLMIALYRAGRQADALTVAAQIRTRLDAEYGLMPSSELRELERSILNHDDALRTPGQTRPTDPIASAQHVVVAGVNGHPTADLIDAGSAVSQALGITELVAVQLTSSHGEVSDAARSLTAATVGLPVTVRVAALASASPAKDVARLIETEPVALLVSDLVGPGFTEQTSSLLTVSACDVALVSGAKWRPNGPIIVLFSGSEHDWAAVGVAANLAHHLNSELLMLAVESSPATGNPSRLLASASLVIQRAFNVSAPGQLVSPSIVEIVSACETARMICAGVSTRWNEIGVGPTRAALVEAGLPVVLLRRGSRPSPFAPAAAKTQYSWSMSAT